MSATAGGPGSAPEPTVSSARNAPELVPDVGPAPGRTPSASDPTPEDAPPATVPASGPGLGHRPDPFAAAPARAADDPASPASAPPSAEDLAEAAFRRIADTAPVMIWRTDAAGACDFFNRPWLDFAGRTLQQEIGAGWSDRLFSEDRDACLAHLAGALAGRSEFAMDYRLRRHDGAWRWIRGTGGPWFGPDGGFAGLHGACIDITEMREATDRLRRADAEREMLLAELRHRVKNNAQATLSFLALQARRAAEPGVAAALRSAATRVLLASQVQDRKFNGAALQGVEIGEELDITARAAMEAAGRPGIALEIRPLPERLVVTPSQAIPLALVASEILVNAARHAFPEGRAGRVLVALASLPDGQVELRIADDGVGLPEAVRRQPPRDCLGLHLATRLARQAQGSLRFEGPPGTVAVVTFRPA